MDSALRTRRPQVILAGVIALGLTAALVFPVAFVIQAGAAPYEAVARVHPGYAVSILTTSLWGITELASILTVGALISVLFFRPTSPTKTMDLQPGVDRAILKAASGIWALGSGLLLLIDPLDTSGVPFSELGTPGALDYVLDAGSNQGALIVRFIFTTIVALTAVFATRWTTLLVTLWASVIAVLAPIVVGHVLVGPSHDLGLDAAAIQALAAYPLLGLLVVLAVQHLAGQSIHAATWRRLLIFGAIAVPVILATDAVVTWFKLAGSGLFDSLTGQFISLRWLGLVALIGALFIAWRAYRNATTATRAGLVLTLGVVATSIWLAFTVTLTREPPPQFFVPTSISEIFLGFDVPEPPTFGVLMSHWRLNLLITTLAVAAITAYLVALVVARRRGTTWPVGRTICWLLGWATVLFVINSGIGKYSAPHFGIHMLMHMSLNMVAPILLAMGGVVTLLLRACRADSPIHSLRNWITWVMAWRGMKLLYNPLLIFAMFVASFYVLYFTGLFETLMTYHWGHQLMNLHFLLVGFLYYSLIIGVDRTPRTLPHIARLGMALAIMPFHAFFGVILMNNETIIARDYYTILDMPWADLAAAQEMGGAVAWAGGEIPALIVVVALGLQWARQDKKEAIRRDRHIDSGRDTEYDDYNRMLARLGQRNTSEMNQDERL